jgi:predicted small secreted protein
MAIRLFRLVATLVVAAGTLAGCATSRMIDSDVQSFPGTPTAAVPSSFSFERLPSQKDARNQDALEAMAAAALEKKGLKQNGTDPAYRVQLNFQSEMLVREPRPGSYPVSVGFGFGFGYGHYDHRDRYGSSGIGVMMQPSWYRNSVHLVLRESASSRVAYETTASFDGPWSDAGNLFPAVLDAALDGFPNPPSGSRKVVIELPANTTSP